jgi:hypothetical protein
MKRVLASIALIAASVMLVACGGGATGSGSDNPAEGMSVAMFAYTKALGDYLNTTPDTTVNQSFVETTRAKLTILRHTFTQVQSEASGIDFPTVYEKKGQPAQATVTEYLSATDAFITLEEMLLKQLDSCVSSGSAVNDCVSRVAESAMVGVYPDVIRRAQAAALQLQQESSTGP